MAKGKLMFWGAAGAAAMYFFDPDKGRTRRALVQDKITKLRTRGSQVAERTQTTVASQAQAVQQQAAAAQREEAPPANDQTLAAKVESEVLGKEEYPKGSINVNVENGVVYLRGEVTSQDQKSAIEQDVRKITGVTDVRNMLHLPGEPAPTKE